MPCLRIIPVLALAFLLAVPDWPCSAQESPTDAQRAEKLEFFENKIRPVLVEHCYECHSTESKTIQGGLLLDSATGISKGGDSGPTLVTGQIDKSLIVQALRYESTQMPPKGKLAESIVQDFERWIADGAIDPREGPSQDLKKQIDFQQARNFWSFQPPRRPTMPTPNRSDWAQCGIDHFTLAAMEAHSLAPVEKAGKRELIRRATFDLTGLPPTVQEIENFLSDSSEDAFSKVIDRLLNSEAYGQRWGRYWLDVARYSEDQAHTFSVQPNTNGYRYRDWVIKALNSDMPFNRFIQYQIAADVMEMDESERLSNLAALGYFGLGAQYYKNTDAAKAAADELDDRIDTLTRGFLGLTVSCARCHDHKFDPIPQQDYYSLAGVFHSSRLHTAPLVPADQVEAFNAAQRKIKSLEESINQEIAREAPKLRESRVDEVAKYLLATHTYHTDKVTNNDLNPKEFAKSNNLNETFFKRWLDYLKQKNEAPPQLLKHWVEALQKGDQQGIQKSADDLQQRLKLMIRQRDGLLTQDEQATLDQLTKANPSSEGNARLISPRITKTQPSTSIDVDLAGAKELILVVNDGGNGASCDHADWINPKLVTSSGEVLLTDLKWKSTSASYGTININKSVTGQPLRVAGTVYPNGIGTHSTSIITYELPQGTQRFTAMAGLDNGGTDQGGDCGANAAVEFRVYTETPRDIQVGQPDLIADFFGEKGIFAFDPKSIESLLPDQTRTAIAEKRSELESLRRSAPAMYAVAHVIAEAKPSDLKVMIRGNPANLGQNAPRRFLKILSTNEPESFSKGSGRLELAQAIASPENPLTARVMVNRIWQHHFGRGLVSTPDNFGKLGDPPSHPELLDYLSVKFIEQGWSLKSMHRDIMLSATYQLSSQRNEANMQIDADNRYLWRMNRRRLDVEAWRDALLAASGRLNPILEGPSTNLADATNNRRTIYGFISRHELDNMLRLFDFPDANITASTRAETTVPQQQLFVLNSPFMIEQAKAFASRVLSESGPEPHEQIRHAYLVAFGRPPTEREIGIGTNYLRGPLEKDDNSAEKLSRWETYAQALLASNEFMYLD